MSFHKSNFFIDFFLTFYLFFTDTKISKNSLGKHYHDNKERLQKSIWKNQNSLRKKKKKATI